MKITTKKGAFGFGALIQTIRDYSIKKLNIIYLDCHASIWQWELGGCRGETLNPFSSWLYTLKCIWKDDYSWHGGTWIDNPEWNTQNITEDTKLNFLSKCIASWRYCFRPLLSKHGIGWQYRNGPGVGEFTYVCFKWWTLSLYRSHTNWFEDRYQHSWKDKKFQFSKKWKDYDHEYVLHCSYGTWEKKISEEEFETSLDSEEVSYE